MKPLDLYSEPFSPTGNVTSEGVINPLGRPALDPFSLLIRETVANSWDARGLDWGGITFGIEAWTPGAPGTAILRDVLFRDRPDRLPLAAVLDQQTLPEDEGDDDADPTLRLLALSDRGTIGLGGPTRADRPSPPGQPRDYVDFLRNIGLPPDRPMTAGTYGYGKAAAYLASRARTICVYTRWLAPGGPESRFQAAGLGSAHSTAINGSGDRLLTGRHWWGRMDDGVVEPVVGAEADLLAGAIGLPVMDDQTTGTTILLVGPRLNGRSLEAAVNAWVGAALWNFWPKMLQDTLGRTPITFRASCEGRRVHVPDPRRHPPLDGFVQALEALDAGQSVADEFGIVTSIDGQRPRRRLGGLAIRKFASLPRTGLGANRPPAVLDGPAHHVAFMRQMRLVVKYDEGPPLPVDGVGYAGVFVADPSVDDIFRAAEPPTHDDWIDSLLDSHTRSDRSVINVSAREIRSKVERFVQPPALDQGAAAQGGEVAALAADLAGLLPGLGGPGPEVGPLEPESGRRGTVRRARVRVLGRPQPVLENGAPTILVRFQVDHVPDTAGTTIAARAAVALENGALEMEVPDGAETPRVVGWRSPDGRRIEGNSVFVAADVTGDWTLVVTAVPDLMVGVDIAPVTR